MNRTNPWENASQHAPKIKIQNLAKFPLEALNVMHIGQLGMLFRVTSFCKPIPFSGFGS
jgi:hypothetical protein